MTQSNPEPPPEALSFDGFMSQLLKPTYVWRMASSITGTRDRDDQRPMARSARTRMRNAARRIDDLVLQRAAVIADERRCKALGTSPVGLARCEYQRGHEPVYGRISIGPNSMTANNQPWDHGAPSVGVWWQSR
jgi:hypothetical protein